MSKATETAMNVLHNKLATTLSIMSEVRTVKTVSPTGDQLEETVEPSPAVLAVAAKFLKDNSIFSTPEQSDALSQMRDNLDRRTQRPSKRDLQDALKQIGSDLVQ